METAREFQEKHEQLCELAKKSKEASPKEMEELVKAVFAATTAAELLSSCATTATFRCKFMAASAVALALEVHPGLFAGTKAIIPESKMKTIGRLRRVGAVVRLLPALTDLHVQPSAEGAKKGKERGIISFTMMEKSLWLIVGVALAQLLELPTCETRIDLGNGIRIESVPKNLTRGADVEMVKVLWEKNVSRQARLCSKIRTKEKRVAPLLLPQLLKNSRDLGQI